MKKRVLVLVSVLLSSCALVDEAPQVNSEELATVSYNLYVSRSSMTTTEFEQYKLLPAGLFSECGTIHRGRPETRQQMLEKVEQEKLAQTRALAMQIYNALSSSEPPPVDAPGDNSSLADPGKYTLHIQVGQKKSELKTSFDFVEKQQTLIASRARTLTRLIRSMPSRFLCGNQDFYGIDRRL